MPKLRVGCDLAIVVDLVSVLDRPQGHALRQRTGAGARVCRILGGVESGLRQGAQDDASSARWETEQDRPRGLDAFDGDFGYRSWPPLGLTLRARGGRRHRQTPS